MHVATPELAWENRRKRRLFSQATQELKFNNKNDGPTPPVVPTQ